MTSEGWKTTEMNSPSYNSQSRAAIADPVLHTALANLQERFGKGAAQGYLNFPEGPDLRLKAHDIRMDAIGNLDILLEALTDNIRKSGGHVHFARDALV